MRDKLREYVGENLPSFDRAEAPDVWAGINSAMQSPQIQVKPVNTITMIKYGLGLTVLATSTFLLVKHYSSAQSPRAANQVAVAELKREVKIEGTASVPHPAEAESIKMSGPVLQAIPVQQETATLFQDEIEPATAQLSATKPEVVLPDSVPLASGVSQDTLFTGISELQVNVSFCRVKLQGIAGNKLSFASHMNRKGETGIKIGRRIFNTYQSTVKWSVNGSKLKVWVESEKATNCDQNDDEPSLINFGVPAGVKISVSNSSGSISADSLVSPAMKFSSDFGNVSVSHLTGASDIHAESGKIKASHIKGDLTCRADFGNIHADNIEGRFTADCSSGSISVESLTGDALVKTSFGSQKYSKVKGNIHAVASSGSIRFSECSGDADTHTDFGSQTFDGQRGNIHAEASSGTVKLNDTKGKLEVVTNFGSIKGEKVELLGSAELKASSGMINIDFANPISDLSFDLNSTSGSASVDDGNKVLKSANSLRTGNGPILVTGNTSFGLQYYR